MAHENITENNTGEKRENEKGNYQSLIKKILAFVLHVFFNKNRKSHFVYIPDEVYHFKVPIMNQ